MNKVTVILKDGTIAKIENVTYILYYAESKIVIVENGNITHDYRVSEIATMDVE